MKKIFLLFILFAAFNKPALADTYYSKADQIAFAVEDCNQSKVSSCETFYIDGINGNDAWDGLAANYISGINGPFKTITHALDRYSSRMKGGNVFKIKAGTYYERISLGGITSNISEDTRFTLGSYGDGEVIIDASDSNLLTWAQDDNPNIYKSDYSSIKLSGSAQAIPQAVVMDNNAKWGRPVDAYSELTSNGKWYYDSAAKILYVYTGGESPAAHDVVVVKHDPDTVEPAIYNPGYDYVTIEGLTVRGAGSYGYFGYGDSNGKTDYNLIAKNEFKFNGKGGLLIIGNNASIIKNNFYGNILLNWPRGTTWDTSGGWPPAITIQGKNGYVSGNVVYHNGGEGLIVGDNDLSTPTNVIIENNKLYDNWSVNIYFDHVENGDIRNNLVYCTGPVESDAMDVDKIPAWTNVYKIYKRERPDGIVTADENDNPRTKNINIYNNFILGCATGYNHYSEAFGSGIINNKLFNNTIVVPSKDIANVDWIGLDVIYNNGNNSNSLIKNNIVLASDTSGYLVAIPGATSEIGVTLDDNLYFSTSNTPFSIGVYGSTLQTINFTNYKSAMSGFDNSSLFADPLLNNSNGFTSNDAKLSEGSPAIDSGAELSEVVQDFFGNLRPFGNGYDIGAHEFGATPPPETIPPVISGGLPNGILSFGTTNSIISVSTDENATCKYSLQPDQQFSTMTAFTTTGLQAHSFLVNVSNGNSYTYYVKCSDVFNNITPADYAVSFSVASSSDSTPPSLSFLAPSGSLASGTTNTTLSLITDEKATCKYSTNSNIAYSLMANNFSTSNNLLHQALVSGFADGSSHTYYVRCKDLNGNANTTDAQIKFTVNLQITSYQQSLYWSGSTNIPDQTLSGTTIISTGTPAYVNGHDSAINGARNLATDNNYVTFSKTNDFDWNNGKMSFWFYPTTIYSNDIFTFQWANGKYFRMNSASNGRFSVSYDFNNGGISRFTDSVTANNWHFVEISWDLSKNTYDVKIDNSDLEIYSNNPSWVVVPSNELLYFGRGPQYTTYNRAYLDELYFYSPVTDSVAPIISSVSVSNTDLSSTSISWITNENAISQIEYGLTSSYGLMTSQDDALVISHSQKIVSLLNGTIYHYRVKSTDASGNVSYSNDATFTTLENSNIFAISNFVTMITNWFHKGSAIVSDLNSDNIVNAKDLGIMMNKWN